MSHGFFGWLGDRSGIHSLRPLAAPAGAIVGGMLGGPMGAALGAGLGKTGANLSAHDSLGHALGQGVLNGALAYGAGSLFQAPSAIDDPDGALAGMPVQVTPNAANPELAKLASYGNSTVRDGVMRRVMGGVSNLGSGISNGANWLNNNSATVDTLGNLGGGILKANEMNAQNRIAQENADANRDYIQSQIDAINNRRKAFEALYAMPLPPQGPSNGPNPFAGPR